MEPYSLAYKVAESLFVKTASSLLSELITNAKHEKDDVARCKIYLEAAEVAIQGLENEYVDIRIEAEACRLDQLDNIVTLQNRIKKYLAKDLLRKDLWNAEAGLKGCCAALQANVERKWWPDAKVKRQEAVTDLVNTLEELKKYINDLNVLDVFMRNISGVGATHLNNINDCLSKAINIHAEFNKKHLDKSTSDLEKRRLFSEQLTDIQNELNKFIQVAREDVSQDKIKDSITRIRNTIEKLTTSFR